MSTCDVQNDTVRWEACTNHKTGLVQQHLLVVDHQWLCHVALGYHLEVLGLCMAQQLWQVTEALDAGAL